MCLKLRHAGIVTVGTVSVLPSSLLRLKRFFSGTWREGGLFYGRKKDTKNVQTDTPEARNQENVGCSVCQKKVNRSVCLFFPPGRKKFRIIDTRVAISFNIAS